MELRVCALVITAASLVSATPYGYGTKNGAAAKAQANAAAGAFSGLGGIPVNLANGGSISGSYSKSAASSYAASSASSSSFSFSGSGAGGYNGNDFTGSGSNGGAGSEKCSTGACQNGNVAGPQSFVFPNPGSLPNSGAFAAAGAAAFAGAGVNGNAPCSNGECPNKHTQKCNGDDCNTSSEPENKCPSGDCVPSPDSNKQIVENSPSKKCTTGDCKSGSDTEDTDDIPVKVSDAPKKTNEHSANNYQSANTDTKCFGGNCDLSQKSNTNIPSSSHETTPAESSPKCSTPNCGNTIDITNSAPAKSPSSYLATPKETEPCTSENCGSPNTNSLNKQPSSYDVPTNGIYTSTPFDKENIPCTSGICDPPPKVSNNPHPEHPSTPKGVGCTSNNCNNNEESNNPFSNHQPPYNSPTSNGPNNCAFGKCGTSPQQNSGQDSPLGREPSDSYYGNSPNNSPSGPAGSGSCGKGGCNDPSSPSYNYNHAAGNSPTGKQGPGGCTSGNCAVPSQVPSINGPGYQPGPKAPNYGPNSSSLPRRPSICTTGNCGDSVSHTFGNVPNYPSEQTPSYSHGSPNTYSPLNGPIGCANGNCNPSTTINGPNFNSAPKPPSYSPGQAPSYSQPGQNNPPGCGSGNCDSFPSGNRPNYQSGYRPSGEAPDYSPPGPSGPIDCASGNCGGPGKPPLSNGPNYQSNFPATTPVYPTNVPQGGCASGSCGSFLKPPFDHVNKPLGHSHEHSAYVPSGPQVPGGCQSGNCAGSPPLNSGPSYPLGSKVPSYAPSSGPLPSNTVPTGSYSGPSSHPGSSNVHGTSSPKQGCTTGNCAVEPSEGPAYSGGFGGPPGLLKPHEYKAEPQINKPTTNINHNNPSPCSSGNCGKTPQNVAPQHDHQGVQSGSHAVAGAAATASAGVYTGSFGGPPGLLKPFDESKPGDNGSGKLSPGSLGNFPSSPHSPGAYNKPSTGGVFGLAGAGAQAGAISGAYGAGSGKDGHGGAGGCNVCGGGGGAGNHGDHSASFAVSSAVAHASAGTKGGYGKK